jgi:hypothetical protein
MEKIDEADASGNFAAFREFSTYLVLVFIKFPAIFGSNFVPLVYLKSIKAVNLCSRHDD